MPNPLLCICVLIITYCFCFFISGLLAFTYAGKKDNSPVTEQPNDDIILIEKVPKRRTRRRKKNNTLAIRGRIIDLNEQPAEKSTD